MVRRTSQQQEILKLLIEDGLTPKQISIRRQTSIQNTYKIIRKLKENGMISKTFRPVENDRCTIQPKKHEIRLHAQEFNIRLIRGSKKYDKVRQMSNFIKFKGHSVRLFSKSLEIYSGRSFYGPGVPDAVSFSVDHWNKLFVMLENHLDIVILKDRYQNIKQVKAHFSEIHNELARDCEVKGDKIKFRCNRDGKVYALIDNSFNLHEFETVHPVTSQGDMAVFKAYFDDLRHNPHYTPSEQKGYIDDILKALDTTVKTLKVVVDLEKLRSSPPSLKPSPMKGIRPKYIG